MTIHSSRDTNSLLKQLALITWALILISGLLGCSDQKSSKINNEPASAPAATIDEIGNTLGITAPKPAVSGESGLGFRVNAGATQYADSNVLIQLNGSIDLVASTRIAKHLPKKLTWDLIRYALGRLAEKTKREAGEAINKL